MVTFKKIYESLFSSFRIADASILLAQIEQEKIEKVLIIKRSWIFGFFVSLTFFLVLSILWVNIYFIFLNYSSLLVLSGMIGFFIANVTLGISSGLFYLYRFRKIHGVNSIFMRPYDIRLIKEALIPEEENFTRFFNRITLNYYLLIISTLFSIYYVSIEKGGSGVGLSSLYEIFFLIVQIILIAYYRRHMIDLEMDYAIVTPNRIYFVDQFGVYRRDQSIRWVTNIRIVTSNYPNFIGSLCNYGTIEIIIKGDTPAISLSYHMRYVDHPVETVNRINQLIEKEAGIGL